MEHLRNDVCSKEQTQRKCFNKYEGNNAHSKTKNEMSSLSLHGGETLSVLVPVQQHPLLLKQFMKQVCNTCSLSARDSELSAVWCLKQLQLVVDKNFYL